jgi:hypothetical protein
VRLVGPGVQPFPVVAHPLRAVRRELLFRRQEAGRARAGSEPARAELFRRRPVFVFRSIWKMSEKAPDMVTFIY